MEIVIDIPEEIKQKRDAGKVLSNEEIATVCMAIKNGTPLPKSHGDLIDRNELRCENTDFDTYNDYSIMFDEINNAETVVEADGGAE